MAVTVDLVLFDTSTTEATILLIKRANDPYKNHWALPGGFVDMDEKIESAARRELEEETAVKIDKIEFLGYFDDINRDPRERTISFVFMATTNKQQHNIVAADDASDAKWYPVTELPKLAFDHPNIIELAIAKLKR